MFFETFIQKKPHFDADFTVSLSFSCLKKYLLVRLNLRKLAQVKDRKCQSFSHQTVPVMACEGSKGWVTPVNKGWVAPVDSWRQFPSESAHVHGEMVKPFKLIESQQ